MRPIQVLLLLQEQKFHRVLEEVCFEALDQTRSGALDTAGKTASGLCTPFHVDAPDGEQVLQRLAGRFLCFPPKIVEHSRYLQIPSH
jgi:hypothetical protein